MEPPTKPRTEPRTEYRTEPSHKPLRNRMPGFGAQRATSYRPTISLAQLLPPAG
jgi:hypothetical protein